jgi:hypothetical protein
MKMKRKVSSLLLGAALACGPAVAFSQQPYPGEDHTAKQDMKNAGHESKQAAKDAGQGVKHGAQKAKRHTKRGWHRTKNATTGAVNGAREGAHNPQ